MIQRNTENFTGFIIQDKGKIYFHAQDKIFYFISEGVGIFADVMKRDLKSPDHFLHGYTADGYQLALYTGYEERKISVNYKLRPGIYIVSRANACRYDMTKFQAIEFIGGTLNNLYEQTRIETKYDDEQKSYIKTYPESRKEYELKIKDYDCKLIIWNTPSETSPSKMDLVIRYEFPSELLLAEIKLIYNVLIDICRLLTNRKNVGFDAVRLFQVDEETQKWLCFADAFIDYKYNQFTNKSYRNNILFDYLGDCISNLHAVVSADAEGKEEILEYIDKENFNALKYLKQDYFNFKKYIGSEFYPRHVDYINNDCAPDLIRFMSIKTRGKKNCSYYNFLRGIGEENLPVFTEKQIDFINYLSGLLPLVRVHEYQIVKLLLDGPKTYRDIVMYLTETVQGFVPAELEHALTYLQFVEKDKDILRLSVPMDDQLLEYMQDLIEYGLIRYVIDNGNETGFKLWLNYRMDQVQLKLLKNPGNIMVGTYYYDDYVVIFASLKKDLEEANKLNYKDKFLQPDLFQWESMTNLPQSHLEKLMKSTFAHVFIRKMTTENGLVLPFTYVGKGKMSNPRKTDGDNGTYLFDIHMENELPEYLQYDFGLTKE